MRHFLRPFLYFILFLLCWTLSGPLPLGAHGASHLPGISAAWAAKRSAPVAVAQVINGKSLILATGETLRLASIQAPNMPDNDATPRPGEPLAEEAKAALERLVGGQSVTFTPVPDSPDRRGRIVAELFDQNGQSVQEALIRAGYAMVYSFPDHRAPAKLWLALEAEARAAKRGIWANAHYAVLPAARAAESLGRFRLVEGVVQEVAEIRGTVYLNFGQNWRDDFTVMITKRDLRRFADVPLAALAGKKLRVRGWIHEKNGPMITLSHPEQLEVLDR